MMTTTLQRFASGTFLVVGLACGNGDGGTVPSPPDSLNSHAPALGGGGGAGAELVAMSVAPEVMQSRVSLSFSPNPPVLGQSVTVTATVPSNHRLPAGHRGRRVFMDRRAVQRQRRGELHLQRDRPQAESPPLPTALPMHLRPGRTGVDPLPGGMGEVGFRGRFSETHRVQSQSGDRHRRTTYQQLPHPPDLSAGGVRHGRLHGPRAP